MKLDIVDYLLNNKDADIQDLFKFIYQACFGCEHLVDNYDFALLKIKEEMVTASSDDLPDVEYLTDKYCRVHIKALKNDSDAEKLAEAFVNSSEKEIDGKQNLEQALEELKKLSKNNSFR